MLFRTNQTGFSLIELLIVVSIILVIAAIVIPNYLAAKIRANEAVAVADVRALISAQAMYSNMFPQVGFSPDIQSLAGNANPPTPGAAGLVPDELTKPGKAYTLSVTPKTQGAVNVGYTLYSTPTRPGFTGKRGFCASESGTVTYSDDGSTNCNLPLPF